MGLLTEFKDGLITGYKDITQTVPTEYSSLINLFIFAILIALYAIFTWKFYRYLSKKDLIELNLQQYNRTTHPFLNKLFAMFLYLIEYIIILPFLIFFWFAVLALLILVLSEELVINQVIIVSAAIVAAIRMLAYYEEDLSKDLAKIFPFTVLVIFILSPGFFSLERIISNLSQIPTLLTSILYFLIFIIVLELILRTADTLINLARSDRGEIVTEVIEEGK
ncbi:MAG: hypothetical protein IIA87_05130 [Nanoarchaeota archaeon]|nr:hypothetical protein [Nanoarchaeota archaeon]